MIRLTSIIKNQYAKGSIWLTSVSLIGGVGNYIFTILTARILGPHIYSEIVVFLSYSALCSLPFTVIQTITTNYIAKQKNKDAKNSAWTLYKMLVSRNIYLLVSITILGSIVTGLSTSVLRLNLIDSILLGPFIIFSAISGFSLSILQGIGLFSSYSLLSLSTVLGRLLGLPVSALTDKTATPILFFLIIAACAVCVISRFIIKIHVKDTKQKLGQKKVKLPHIFTKEAILSVSISLTALTLFNTLDIIIAKQIMSADNAGLYASWSLFGKVLFYVIGPLVPLLFVYFSKQKIQKHTIVIGLVLLTLTSSLCMYIIYVTIGPIIIHILFGPRFDPVAPYLKYAAIYAIGYTLIHLFYTFFLARNVRVNIFFALSQIAYIIGGILIPKDFFSFLLMNIIFGIVVSAMYGFLYLLDSYRADV